MKTLGFDGEELAADFLKKKGYRILERNYKTRIGEIDIIAKDRNTTVFIEVKTRANYSFGYPFASVNNSKRQKLRKLALLFLKTHPKEDRGRFDVISIFLNKHGEKAIEHIKDAFEV